MHAWGSPTISLLTVASSSCCQPLLLYVFVNIMKRHSLLKWLLTCIFRYLLPSGNFDNKNHLHHIPCVFLYSWFTQPVGLCNGLPFFSYLKHSTPLNPTLVLHCTYLLGSQLYMQNKHIMTLGSDIQRSMLQCVTFSHLPISEIVFFLGFPTSRR